MKRQDRKAPANGATITCLASLLLFVGSVGATPPTTPWREWERKAQDRGADAVRNLYQKTLQDITQQLNRWPVDSSVENFSQRLILTGELIQYLDSWTLVESRELHKKGDTANQLNNTVWPQLMSFATSALRFVEELKTHSKSLRARQPDDQPQHWSIKLTDVIYKNVDHMGWRLALLGKLSNDADRVRQVFTLIGAPINAYATPEAFTAAKLDVPHALQLSHVAQPRDAGIPERVGNAEQASARAFMARFFESIRERNDKSLESMISLVEFPVSTTAQDLISKLTPADIDRARFRFDVLGRDEFVARMDGVITARGAGADRAVFVRNLAFRFRTTDTGLKLLSIGGLQ